ncbi:unnamed protein product [Citrullus colocynthis]|uniref:Uncharacterized protein n=1 Tax=Citrullus colocynthis TaxID=252529 RepID=A0ABP0Z5N8_9ROSI
MVAHSTKELYKRHCPLKPFHFQPPTFSYWITLSSPSLPPFFSLSQQILLSGFLPLWIDFQFLAPGPNSYLSLSFSPSFFR